MNRTFKRLALPVAAAAALGSAGFAFMASNSVAASSAGEGDAAVTGYTVSNITYQLEQGWGQPSPIQSVGSVKFTLTSNSDVTPANGQPAFVNAALLGTSANVSECTVSGWTISGSNHGTGGVSCYFGTSDGNSSPVVPVSGVTGLDVTANQ